MRGFVGLMRGLGVLDYRLHDCERLQRPGLLVLANHPTLIDVVFLLALIPHADCVVKGRLARNPFTRGPIRAAGYITNEEPQGVLEAAGASLARGNALILFPEGTRSVPGRAQRARARAEIPPRRRQHRAAHAQRDHPRADRLPAQHPDQGRALVSHPGPAGDAQYQGTAGHDGACRTATGSRG